MSQVNHITNVRPGDRWDGVALNIHKTSFDWSQAQVTVQLRLGVRGPLVANIAFSQSAAVDTLVLGFYLTAVDTAKLKLGNTYYGTVTVQIPNANPALEPTFGPYTLFTWAMEMSDRAQSGSETYTVEFGSSTVFNISLNEGSTITISGGGGGGGGGAPSAHAATHRHGGSDEVATGTPSANAIPKADPNGKLDTWVSSGAAAGTASLRALGTGALQACAGNDGRLSDARTPVAHTHPVGEVTGLGGAATLNVGSGAGTVCAGDDSRLSNSRTPTAHAASHKHGGADEVAVATPAGNAIPKADGAGKLDAWITSSGAAATPSLRILGTGATDACAGNDARLSNARTPTAHTHTASEVTDFNEAVDDRVGALLVAGANITITYNDAGNTLTITSTGGGGGGVASDPIFDAAGDLAIGTGPDASARLAAPSYHGAQLGFVFGNVEWIHPRTHLIVVEDFVGSEASANFGVYGWERFQSGAGSAFSHIASESNRPGIAAIETGSTSAGYYNLTWRNNNQLLLGGGRIYVEWAIKIPTLSNGTDTFTVQVGLHDNQGPGVVDGVYLEYTHGTNSGQWVLKGTSNTTSTTTNSTTAADINYHSLAVDVNAAGTSVTFYIDGVSVGTVASNIPTGAGRELVPSCMIIKSLGTASAKVYIDYCHIVQKFTTPR